MGQGLLELEKKAKLMQEEAKQCRELSTLLLNHTWNVAAGRSLWTRKRHLSEDSL